MSGKSQAEAVSFLRSIKLGCVVNLVVSRQVPLGKFKRVRAMVTMMVTMVSVMMTMVTTITTMKTMTMRMSK